MTTRRGKTPEGGRERGREKQEEARAGGLEALTLNLELLWLHIRDNVRSGKLEQAIARAHDQELLDDLMEAKAKIVGSFDTLYMGVAKDNLEKVVQEINAEAERREKESVPHFDKEKQVGVDHDEVYEVRADTDALRKRWEVENQEFEKIVDAHTAVQSLRRDLDHLESTLGTSANEVTRDFIAKVTESVAALRTAIEGGKVCIEQIGKGSPAQRSEGISACTNTLRVAFETFIRDVTAIADEIVSNYEYPETVAKSVLVSELERDATLVSGKGAMLKNLHTALKAGLLTWAETASSPTQQAILSKFDRAARLLRTTDEGLSDTENVVAKLEKTIAPARKHREELVGIRTRKQKIRKKLNPKEIDLNAPPIR